MDLQAADAEAMARDGVMYRRMPPDVTLHHFTVDSRVCPMSSILGAAGNRSDDNRLWELFHEESEGYDGMSPSASQNMSELSQRVLMDKYLLQQIFEFLPTKYLLRAALVCKEWRAAAKARANWKSIDMDGLRVRDWSIMREVMLIRKPHHIDLSGLLTPHEATEEDEMWHRLCHIFGALKELKSLMIYCCPEYVLHAVLASCSELTQLNVNFVCTDTVTLQAKIKATKLDRLVITAPLRCTNFETVRNDMVELKNLKTLSLMSFIVDSDAALQAIGNLTQLERLEIGELMQQRPQFADVALKTLTNLRSLTIGHFNAFDADSGKYMDVLLALPLLQELNMVQVLIDPFFPQSIKKFTKLRVLKIAPSVMNSCCDIRTMLQGVQSLSKTLHRFVWWLITGDTDDQSAKILNAEFEHQIDEWFDEEHLENQQLAIDQWTADQQRGAKQYMSQRMEVPQLAYPQRGAGQHAAQQMGAPQMVDQQHAAEQQAHCSYVAQQAQIEGWMSDLLAVHQLMSQLQQTKHMAVRQVETDHMLEQWIADLPEADQPMADLSEEEQLAAHDCLSGRLEAELQKADQWLVERCLPYEGSSRQQLFIRLVMPRLKPGNFKNRRVVIGHRLFTPKSMKLYLRSKLPNTLVEVIQVADELHCTQAMI